VLSFAKTTASDGRSRALLAAVACDGPLVVVWLAGGKELIAATIHKIAIRIICLLEKHSNGWSAAVGGRKGAPRKQERPPFIKLKSG
jgi:hypothetical protein